MYTHSPCERQPYALSPELSADILQNGGGRKTFPPFVCLAAESYHNLHKVWSTRELNELLSFVLVADVKAISLTTGIGTHDSRAVLQPLEELVELTGHPLSSYSDKNVESQHRYYESYYARLLFNLLNHELSKEQFLKSIISYNSLSLQRLCL